MSFPDRLKAARKAIGLTQEQLGFELDVTKSTVSAWENGRDQPSFRLLPELQKTLGVSLDHLVCGEENRNVTDSGKAYGAEVRSEAEAGLLKAYRRLTTKRRNGLIDLLG